MVPELLPWLIPFVVRAETVDKIFMNVRRLTTDLL